MNAPIDRRPAPTWLLTMGALFFAFIAWRVVTLGMAEHLAPRNPAAALAWRNSDAEARLQELDLQAADHRYSAAQSESARAAIRSAPLDGRGYRMLANQVELRGDLPTAMSIYSIAANRGPRDLPTLGRLINYQLTRGNRAQALAYIDQSLRVQPELAPRMFPVVASVSAQDP